MKGFFKIWPTFTSREWNTGGSRQSAATPRIFGDQGCVESRIHSNPAYLCAQEANLALIAGDLIYFWGLFYAVFLLLSNTYLRTIDLYRNSIQPVAVLTLHSFDNHGH